MPTLELPEIIECRKHPDGGALLLPELMRGSADARLSLVNYRMSHEELPDSIEVMQVAHGLLPEEYSWNRVIFVRKRASVAS